MDSIPSFGLGTFRLKDRQVIDSVTQGLAVGYRHIDTAQIYGNETEVGVALSQSKVPREDVFVTTKVWTDHFAIDRLVPSIKESLRKLKLEQLDLTLIHWPAPDNGIPMADYMTALLDAKRQGLTRLIGVSNFTIALMQQAIQAVGIEHIATNQVEMHPFLQNHKLSAFAREHGIHLTAYMPLAYGKVMADPVLQEIAARHHVTPAQISLAWLLQLGHSVIPSSTQRANLIANLAARQLTLSDDDMTAIARLDRHERLANPGFAPAWD
jgi:2,5-diketo-D-gluconate reductase B